MVWTSRSCQDRPSIVMPVDYQVCVAEEADYKSDEESRN